MTERDFTLIVLVAVVFTIQPANAQQYLVVDTGQTTCYDASSEIACPAEGGPLGEGGERYFNFVRCVRDE